MTRTYEDGIIDALNIVRKFTQSGVYNLPGRYIEDQLIDLLPTINEYIDITNQQNKSLENND